MANPHDLDQGFSAEEEYVCKTIYDARLLELLDCKREDARYFGTFL